LMIHGRKRHAESLVRSIEEEVKRRTGVEQLPEPDEAIEIQQRESTGFGEIARTLFSRYPRRSVLGFTLLATQAFVYNAVIFTFSTLLTGVFKVDSSVAGLYLIPFGIANFLGALLLGRLFDTFGRREMITATYFLGGIGMLINGYLIAQTGASVWGFVAVLCGTFFFASAAASSAYLTVSEIFPLETRAMAIALFYAIATGIGGAIGPLY